MGQNFIPDKKNQVWDLVFRQLDYLQIDLHLIDYIPKIALTTFFLKIWVTLNIIIGIHLSNT